MNKFNSFGIAKFKNGEIVDIDAEFRGVKYPSFGLVIKSVIDYSYRESSRESHRKYYVFYTIFVNNFFEIIEENWLTKL